MKESPLDREGNKHGFRAIPVKSDTGRIGANGALLSDRWDETIDNPDSALPFPQRVAAQSDRYTLVDNYECTTVLGVVARRCRRHMIFHIDGRPQFRRVWSFVNGKAR